MDERDFFLEARAQRMATLNCPFCRQANEYSLTWLFRKKRTNINVNQLDERDRAKFEKAQSYMVLLDDHATCLEPGCRRHFEVSGVKTMAFVTPEQLEEISFGQQGRRETGGRDMGGRDMGGRGPARNQGYRQPGGQPGGRPDDRGNRDNRGNREDSGNRGGYGNRDPQGDRAPRQYGQGGQQGGNAPGQRGKQQGNRGGNVPYSPSPSQWNDQQGPRGPRGKRSDPTGPGGGWR